MTDIFSPLHKIEPKEAMAIYTDWGKVSTGIWKRAFDAYIEYYKQIALNRFKTVPDDELPALRTELVVYDKILGIQDRILEKVEAVRNKQ